MSNFLSFPKKATLALSGFVLSLAFASFAQAQLEVTEIMFDPDDDNSWEWFEFRNTGATPIDLDGSFMDHLGDSQIPVTGNPNIASDLGGGLNQDTVIPAGGVAVIYRWLYLLQQPCEP